MADNKRIQRPERGISLRAFVPNAVTALALCVGLSGVRFAFMENWVLAAGAVVLAGILDGLDGRIARLLNAQSRFGAELDSLSDVIAFGVTPALVMFFWSLQHMPQFGWVISLTMAVGCALRLARFNAQIDDEDQPHKSAGFLTGIPAPVAAGLVMLPLYLWVITEQELFRNYFVVGPWIVLIAFLMISNTATFSWSSLRLRKNIRLEALAGFALLGVALINNPWITLSAISIAYIVLIPFSIRSYAKVKRQRAMEFAEKNDALRSSDKV
ncbi:CDP-alcohol phosphatidyltransferase family protein [Parasphingorhabdus cellanae]|uniref:Phosphatidylcholine/phosphatidylserine synthase n=1 Tax=Parasphingorhabdus cellanae TaxID=2806553 RepID=A0ABX7T625_9SPHN|nr:phosphatidylcholine/phosphatidylserine synthase [Parasphingorhabdus cellanae]QTD55919.1 phosphatidylcholine/phosphatidylserine synthase [Parasphingorhabdus cellanae]